MAQPAVVPTIPAPGAWTAWHSPSKHDLFVFGEVTKPLIGVQYTLFAAATQIVAGTNSEFLCSCKPVHPGLDEAILLMFVHQPPDGKPFIAEMKRISPGQE